MQTHRDGVGMFIYSLWNSTAWRLFSCLDASGTQAGAVILYGCHGGANQSWSVQGDGSIRNSSSGLCLTAPATLGNQLTVATCNNSTAQRWTTPA